jgi:tetratricopeptide (TPR) repeat protein
VRARTLLQRALIIRENSLGRTHAELVDLLKSLAALYQDNGDCLDAQSCLERAVAIQESELGREHADLALTLNDLGFVLEYAGDYEASQTAYERALAITVRVHGEHSAEVAACCNSLAIVLENQHDIVGAKALHERSLSIRLQVLSPDHLHVAESQYNLAKLWQAEALSSSAAFYDEDQRQQALATARALHEQALATYHAKLGVRLPGGVSASAALRAPTLQLRIYAHRVLYVCTCDSTELQPAHLDVAMILDNLALIAEACGGEGGEAEALAFSERAELIRQAHDEHGGGGRLDGGA